MNREWAEWFEADQENVVQNSSGVLVMMTILDAPPTSVPLEDQEGGGERDHFRTCTHTRLAVCVFESALASCQSLPISLQ